MHTQEVNLIGVKITAPHGFYPEEHLTSNTFLVDIYTRFTLKKGVDTEDLNQTVNYEILHHIIQETMHQPQKLLETLAQNILERTQSAFNFLTYISVRIKKIQPPMNGEISFSEVVRTFYQ